PRCSAPVIRSTSGPIRRISYCSRGRLPRCRISRLAIGLLLYLVVVSDGRHRADILLLIALALAAIVNIWCAQTGFWIAALLIGGLVPLDRRRILAGILFGILTIKPRLGLLLLLPLMLALTGRWRTMAAQRRRSWLW